jgi:hypothetical protein
VEDGERYRKRERCYLAGLGAGGVDLPRVEERERYKLSNLATGSALQYYVGGGRRRRVSAARGGREGIGLCIRRRRGGRG